jgi:hypothetical protein
MPNIYSLDDHRGEAFKGACTHDGPIATDGGAIRCTACLRQLLMLPGPDGDFRLEWISPLLWSARSCAA